MSIIITIYYTSAPWKKEEEGLEVHPKAAKKKNRMKKCQLSCLQLIGPRKRDVPMRKGKLSMQRPSKKVQSKSFSCFPLKQSSQPTDPEDSGEISEKVTTVSQASHATISAILNCPKRTTDPFSATKKNSPLKWKSMAIGKGSIFSIRRGWREFIPFLRPKTINKFPEIVSWALLSNTSQTISSKLSTCSTPAAKNRTLNSSRLLLNWLLIFGTIDATKMKCLRSTILWKNLESQDPSNLSARDTFPAPINSTKWLFGRWQRKKSR